MNLGGLWLNKIGDMVTKEFPGLQNQGSSCTWGLPHWDWDQLGSGWLGDFDLARYLWSNVYLGKGCRVADFVVPPMGLFYKFLILE